MTSLFGAGVLLGPVRDAYPGPDATQDAIPGDRVPVDAGDADARPDEGVAGHGYVPREVAQVIDLASTIVLLTTLMSPL